jgi:hypothetical protein
MTLPPIAPASLRRSGLRSPGASRSRCSSSPRPLPCCVPLRASSDSAFLRFGVFSFFQEVFHVRKHRTQTIWARAGTFGHNQSVAPGPRRRLQ